MILQMSDYETAFLAMGVMIFFIVLMLVLFMKKRVFLPILVIFLISLIVGSVSMELTDIPFTPWFQVFFLLFQFSIFASTTIQAVNK